MFVVMIISHGFVIHVPEMSSLLPETYQIPIILPDFDCHLLREVISVPTPSPLAPRTPGAQFSLWGLYWTVDLRVWSSLTGDWHGAGSPAIKAWKSKYGGQSQ